MPSPRPFQKAQNGFQMGQKGASALQENPLSQVINSLGNPTPERLLCKCWLCSGKGPGRGIKSECSDCFPSWGLCVWGTPAPLCRAARPTQVVVDGAVTRLGPERRDGGWRVWPSCRAFLKTLFSCEADHLSKQKRPSSWGPASLRLLCPLLSPSFCCSTDPLAACRDPKPSLSPCLCLKCLLLICLPGSGFLSRSKSKAAPSWKPSQISTEH